MKTKTEMAVDVGLCERQLDKYLAKALSIAIIPSGQPITMIDEETRKIRYHPEILEEIKRGITHVRKTRYIRASASRRMGARD
jgi:hypothetical protein